MELATRVEPQAKLGNKVAFIQNLDSSSNYLSLLCSLCRDFAFARRSCSSKGPLHLPLSTWICCMFYRLFNSFKFFCGAPGARSTGQMSQLASVLDAADGDADNAQPGTNGAEPGVTTAYE